MDEANRSFFKDPRIVQLFNRYATYNGSSPYKVPATLNIIPYVEYGFGGYAVAGGIYAIPSALGRLARTFGVKPFLDTRVEKILHDNRRIRGILAGGERLAYDIVVSNVDVLSTYQNLLEDPEARLARRYRALEPSSSGLVFFWGMKDSFSELGVNNIFFSEDYPKEFRELFTERVCPTDPTVYVNITSKVTPQDAPAGCENWFVLINAPCNAGQDWQSEVAAFLRHPNRSRRYRGLYFCGGSVHPGGGMPLAILSGKIASDLIQRHEGIKE